MAWNKNVNWERWVQGELIASLQSKGQLPHKQTEAAQYKNKAYSNTHTRIFPPDEDDPSYAASMLADARSRLTTAAQHIEHSQHKEQQQQLAAAAAAAAALSSQHASDSAAVVKQEEDVARPGSASGRSACGSSAGSRVGPAWSSVGSEASCRTNKTSKSEAKARMTDLQQQLEVEKSRLGALQEAIGQARQKTSSRQKE